jgi:hypothetical protein
LQLAQEEQVGVSKEEMGQLMVALVTSLESKGSLEQTGSTRDAGELDGEPKVNMGELFRPTVAVETTRTSGSALDHGDIRVTLGIANDFPAGVQLEKVRVRFTRSTTSPGSSHPETSAARRESLSRNDSAHLDELALDARTNSGAVLQEDPVQTPTDDLPLRSECGQGNLSEGMALPWSDVARSSQDGEQEAELLLEERDVHLDEKTGVNLVFLHSGVPVGHYTCTGIECVLAGTTFRLLPPSALALAGFDIAVKESTVQVAIDGAPLLMPRPLSQVETLAVSIQANDDVVSNGTLELRVFKRGSRASVKGHDELDEGELEDADEGGAEEDCGVLLLGATLRGDAKLAHQQRHEEPSSVLSLALPPLPRGGSQSYLVSLAVPPLDHKDDSSEPEAETEDTASVVVRASVRYHRDGLDSSAPSATTEIRCAEASFRVLKPLTAVVRLKRVGSRVFASFALTCNAFVPVTLQAYQLLCPVSTADPAAALLRVEQDPNAKLRGTVLRPTDGVHLAFTLAASPELETEASAAWCSLQLRLSYGTDEAWQKAMTVRAPLAEVQGKRYRIDVLPRGQDATQAFTGEAVEATALEPVTFHVHVQEEVAQSNKRALESDASSLSLRLTESSERDWILVGKPLERFTLDPCSGAHAERRREFGTQKRLLAARAGSLRFPAFRLEVDGQAIPSARVHSQQSSRRVRVS